MSCKACGEKRNYGSDFSDFPVGTNVRVRVHFCDGYNWRGERGRVVNNTGVAGGIQVELIPPRSFGDGFVQSHFWFDPGDLKIVTGA